MKWEHSLKTKIGLLALGSLLLGSSVRAQVTTILHNFGDGSSLNTGSDPNQDGTAPSTNLIQGRDGNFYGTTAQQGSNQAGTAFVVTPLGVTTILHNFGASSAVDIHGNFDIDGSSPSAPLIQGNGNDNNFYGTTSNGGANSGGTAFKMTPQGAVTILYNFGNGPVLDINGTSAVDGLSPTAAMIIGSDGNFYGTTSSGGTFFHGVVFKMTTQGAVTVLHTFGDNVVDTNGSAVTDGADCNAALVQGTDGKFYGTTPNGGANGDGVAFSMTSAGMVKILHSFGGNAKDLNSNSTTDGIFPMPSLIQGADGKFYGVTSSGGTNSAGIVFSMTTQGVVTVLHDFGGGTDGTFPTAGVIQGSDHNLYGTTSNGGTGNAGMAFKISLQGVETDIHNFVNDAVVDPHANAATDGSLPAAELVQGTDGNFYGVATFGGTGVGITSGAVSGTVFKIAIDTPSLVAAQNFIGTVGFPASLQINATKNPTQYAAANLPPGLSINATTGFISGKPTATGTGDVVITMTNGAGSDSALVAFTISDYVFAVGSPVNAPLQPVPTTPGFKPDNWTISPTPFVPNLMFDSATGTLTGTPTVPGIYTYTITANYTDLGTEPAIERAVQNYMLVLPATFSSWASGYGVTGATETPQHDAYPNLLKFFLNINPKHPLNSVDRAALPALGIDSTTTPGTNYLTLTFREYALASGITANLQTSTDLKTWTTGTSPAISQQVGVDPVTGDPIMEMGVIRTGSGNQFIRLNVASP
jgi:uncharacterized repeat protein (TIGR03803 family)